MAPQLTGESQLVTNTMVDRCVLRRSCQWAGNGPVDFWRESSRTMALLCIVPPMHGRAIHGVVVGQVGPEGALSAHVLFWADL
jgi:hypothetical protein